MQERTIRANGLDLAAVEWGDGSAPLVLLHGIGSRGVSWLPVADALARRHHVIALDLRGHGGSAKPAAGYLLDDYAADVQAVLDALALERPFVLGHSLGALAVLTWAARFPGRAAKIVVEDPPLRTEPEVLQLFDGWQHLNAAPVAQVVAWFAEQHPEWSPEERQRRAESITMAHPAVFAELRADAERNLASGQLDRLDTLSTIDAPLLALRGDVALGSMTRPDDLTRLAAIAPDARATHIPGAGHSLHREQPAQFLDAVTAFFDE